MKNYQQKHFLVWNSMEKNEVLPARRRILEQKAENLLRRLEKEKNKTMTVLSKNGCRRNHYNCNFIRFVE